MANINIKMLMGLRDNITETNPAPVAGQLLFTKDKGGHIFFDTDGTAAGRIELYKDVIDNLDALVEKVGSIDVATQIQNAVTALEAKIKDAKDAAVAAQEDVDTLGATVGTVETGKTVVGMIAEVKSLITGDGEDTGDQSLTQRVAKNAADIKTNADAIAKLNAASGEGSVADIAAKEIAKALIPEGASESLNTLEEIAAWIQNHPEDVAEMNKNIADNKTAIDALKAALGVTTTPGEGDQPGTETPIVSVADAIANAINELDVADTAEAGKYVSAVSEVDGKIVVTRAELPAIEIEWGTF